MVPSQTPFYLMYKVGLYHAYSWHFLGCVEWWVCGRTFRVEMWAKAERIPRCGGHSVTCAELPH